MHEVRVTVPDGRSKDVARIALEVGIRQASVYRVYVHGPNREMEVVSAETSTPRAKLFIDALLATTWLDTKECSISARELRAILSSDPISETTRPRPEPSVDVLSDLWQLSHLTLSYVGRAVAAAILLAYGMADDSAISVVVAALFMPFLSQILAVSFGLLSRDLGLVKKGLTTIGFSIVACIAAGSLLALLHDGPLLFTGFKGPLVSLAISSVIGVAAGLAIADDAGRRYLIGVAAAVQFAVIPVWFGFSLVHGLPDSHIIMERVGTFFINLFTIAGAAGVVYGLTGMNARNVEQLLKKTRS
jgi:Domain of unknown function (DUF389)